MKYLAVLGRQPEISTAELELLLGRSCQYSLVVHEKASYVVFATDQELNIDRLGGTLKLAMKLDEKPLDYLSGLPEGKITLGVSDYSAHGSRKTASTEALKLKKILVRHGRSVRVVENREATLSTATSLHNGLSGKNPKKVELIKTDDGWYRVIGVQDIDAYAKRDQARPARDAKVGMLPPKLAQILINLCGVLPEGARILDPFCGTGVVLQEALLMGHRAYGTDISERMVEYSEKNLRWLVTCTKKRSSEGPPERGSARMSGAHPWRRDGRTQPEEEPFSVQVGDATSFNWTQPIDAVACEGYLGSPMSQPPVEIKLKTEKQECGAILMGFLKNLAKQIKSGTPVVIAAPAWLRPNGDYERLNLLDEIEELGYNVNNKTREGLLYHREGQIVARDIIILRKN